MTVLDWAIKDSRLSRNLKYMGMHHPTFIQAKVFNYIRDERKNSLICSETGSGKTLAYLAPIIDRLLDKQGVYQHSNSFFGKMSPRCLILAPLPQLQYQILHVLAKALTAKEIIDLKATIFPIPRGIPQCGVSLPDISISSAEHILALSPRHALESYFSRTEVVVIDEMDMVLSSQTGSKFLKRAELMSRKAVKDGRDPIQYILACATTGTFTKANVTTLLENSSFYCSPSLHKCPKNVTEKFERFAQEDDESVNAAKLDRLAELVEIAVASGTLHKWIVFCATQARVERVYDYLETKCSNHLESGHLKRVMATVNADRNKRCETILEFARVEARESLVQVLVCANAASRGVDYKAVDRVIHYDFPTKAADYIHRVGRVARGNQSTGDSIAFVTDKDIGLADCIRQASLGSHNITDARLIGRSKHREQLQIDSSADDNIKYPLTGLLSPKKHLQ